MFGSPALDVAIGTVFLYLLLSLICSAVNEVIEAWLKNRSNDLEHGIFRLLADANPRFASFWGNVWNRLHGGLHLRAQPLAVYSPTTGLASQVYSHGLVRCLYPDDHNLPAYIPAGTFALAPMDLLAPVHGASGTTQTSSRAVPTDDAFYDALQTALIPESVAQSAGDDAVQIRLNIKNWYNSAMERVSGWYKRRTQIPILTLGFGIALVVKPILSIC